MPFYQVLGCSSQPHVMPLKALVSCNSTWMIIYSSHFSSWLQKYWYSIFIVWVFVTCSCPDQFYFGFSSCDSHLVIKLSWLLKTISVPTVQKLLSCVVLFTTHLSATYQNYDSVLATYSKTVGILKSDVPLVLLIISSPSLRVWPKFGDSFYVDIQCFRELQIQLHSLVNLLIPSITLVALCTIPCYQCYIISGNNLWSIKHCWFSSHPLYLHSQATKFIHHSIQNRVTVPRLASTSVKGNYKCSPTKLLHWV